MIKRLAAMAVGTAVAVLAVAPSAHATPNQSCTGFTVVGTNVASVDPTGSTTCAVDQTSAPGMFPVTPRAVSNGVEDVDDDYASLSTFATVAGNLEFTVAERTVVNGTPQFDYSRPRCGTGWQGMRVLAASPTAVYALHDNGRLYRYKIVQAAPTACRLQSAGSLALAGVKAMVLAGVHPDRDVFLITTTTGRLSVLRVPRTTTMTATSSVIRDRSWQGFDTLHFIDGSGTGLVNRLVGVNTTTHTWYGYKLEDATKGLSTRMVADGSVTAAGASAIQFDTSLFFIDPSGA
jgi:hypothetical protein